MKDTETFRDYVRHLFLLECTDEYRTQASLFEGAKDATQLLTYCYLDHVDGLMLEVLCCVSGETYFPGNDEVRLTYRLRDVEPHIVHQERNETDLKKEYLGKIFQLSPYQVNEDIEMIRDFDVLDSSRNPYEPDKVLVGFLKDGCPREYHWCLMEGLEEDTISAILLEEPEADFGVHQGDTIGFCIYEYEGHQMDCICDLGYTEEPVNEAYDPEPLLKALQRFSEKSSNMNYFRVLEELRQSVLLASYSAQLSEEDTRRLAELLENAPEDKKDILRSSFVTHGETTLLPDVIQNAEGVYLPVFTSQLEFLDADKSHLAIPMPFLDIAELALSRSLATDGVVLDPFTRSIILSRDALNTLLEVQKKIEENEKANHLMA